MRIRIFIAVSAGVACLAGVLAIARGQQGTAPRKGGQRRSGQGVASDRAVGVVVKGFVGGANIDAPDRVRPADAGQTWPVDVASWLNLDANTQQLYQQMAGTLSGFTAVPDDRTNYYSAVNDPIVGWVGSVTGVQPQQNGAYLVTVAVEPLLTNYTSVLNDYSEQYLVNNANNIIYIGFLDPNGWAGLPTVLDLE